MVEREPADGSGPEPVVICLLGSFHVQKNGVDTPLTSGGKAENLLGSLALSSNGLSRAALLELLWPNRDPELSRQSLNSLVYSLRRSYGDALGGEAPVRLVSGHYRLNTDVGVSVDIHAFEQAATRADRLRDQGDPGGAIALYGEALNHYRGELAFGSDVHALMERERLRGRHLSVLAWAADQYFTIGDYRMALEMSLEALSYEPCQEDSHRLMMRALVRLGLRAQALRQYLVCRDILAKEFDAAPECATDQLFALIRRDPASA